MAWLILFAFVFGLLGNVGQSPDSSFEIPASESRRGFDTLEEHFGGIGALGGGSIVFRAEQGVDDPVVRMEMESLINDVMVIEGVATVVSPYGQQGQQQGLVSDDGRYGIIQVNLLSEVDEFEAGDIGHEIADLRPEVGGVQIEIGGTALAGFEPPESELIGLAFAVVVLIVAFGSVLAMGLPIGVALAGVGMGAGVVALLSNLTTIPDTATTIGAMIGLGAGIDYALFIVTRYREASAAGANPHEATVIAIDTAGRAVIFAGMTVVCLFSCLKSI